jgi:hypothetical protein
MNSLTEFIINYSMHRYRFFELIPISIKDKHGPDAINERKRDCSLDH